MRAVLILAAGVLCVLDGVAGQVAAPETLHRGTRRVMGTLCEVQVYHADAAVANRAIGAALDEMQRVDQVLSNYDPGSELSAMNREAGRAPFRVSAELFAFVRRCRDRFVETRGAFDPSVGPIVRAWGFFTPQPARPSPEAIASAKVRTGFVNVHLDDATSTVSYDVAGLEIDPGGIGKGYAVDRAVSVLRRAGVASALVSAGGSTLYAVGHPPGRDAWTLGIGDPSNLERPIGHVRLRDAAVSTSGVSRKFVQEGPRRLSHIFNPRTGDPVEGMCQTSVVTQTATDSDALTKAAFILSRDEVRTLFGQRDDPAHALRVEGTCGADGVVWVTPWSSEVFVPRPADETTPGRIGIARTRAAETR